MKFWKILKVVTVVIPVVEGLYWAGRKAVQEIREAFGHEPSSTPRKGAEE